jgi:Sec-independent protein translocase protein TatA
MEQPRMIDEKEVRLLLKNIRKKEILDANKLSIKDMFRICRCIAPQYEKEWKIKEGNYAKSTVSLNKEYPVLMSQMFLNCVWWETFGPECFEYTTEHMSEIMRRMKAVTKQVDRILRESKEAEKEKERVLEEKGLITKEELDQELSKVKQKYREKMDEQDIDQRNAYKTLQRKIADIKAERNHIASENNRMIIESDYLRNRS